MPTRNSIIAVADLLIRDKGFNAFSFMDISRLIGIKTSSIHYHFPTKSDLIIATIREQVKRFEVMKTALENKSPQLKLEGFLSVYSKIKSENNVCLVGSLATDLNTVDNKIKRELKILAEIILNWVTEILQEGRLQKKFEFQGAARTKALMIITNMLAIVQLSRLTNENDFIMVKDAIVKELKTKK